MAYNIKLDVFEGPLDLLLHLIKEHEVEIYDIPIALITEQYLGYIDVMKSLNLDVAGEFLVMASTLTYIKSRTLLPKHEDDEEDDDLSIDPRDELVAKLVEYKKFKESAATLKGRELEQARIFTRPSTGEGMPGEADLLKEVNVFELLKSFKVILDRYSGVKELSVTLEEISVTDKLNEIMARLEDADYITFDALFDQTKSRMEVVATFLALLELMRLKLLRVNQPRLGGEILIYKAVEEPGGAAGDGETDEDDFGPKETGENMENNADPEDNPENGEKAGESVPESE